MTLHELIQLAQCGGNPPRSGCPDQRQAFVYMDVTSAEYRNQAEAAARKRRAQHAMRPIP